MQMGVVMPLLKRDVLAVEEDDRFVLLVPYFTLAGPEQELFVTQET